MLGLEGYASFLYILPKLTVQELCGISEKEAGNKGKPMENQKENIRRPVWGPRLFFLGVLLFIAHLILFYGFKIAAGTLYTALRYGGLGLAVLGWVLWRILKK